MNKVERIKVLKAMELLARQVNNEDIFEEWLLDGVADGDIDYADLSVGNNDSESYEYYLEDEHFRELMGTFIHMMSRARRNGGLYCDGVVTDYMRVG